MLEGRDTSAQGKVVRQSGETGTIHGKRLEDGDRDDTPSQLAPRLTASGLLPVNSRDSRERPALSREA